MGKEGREEDGERILSLPIISKCKFTPIHCGGVDLNK